MAGSGLRQTGNGLIGLALPDGDAGAFYPAYRPGNILICRPDKAKPPSGYLSVNILNIIDK